uniref:Uncharacterized protein n=1 Tax=Romanomermis culicivorax TaxID=13658 RepID=A0A915JM78_ROMCU
MKGIPYWQDNATTSKTVLTYLFWARGYDHRNPYAHSLIENSDSSFLETSGYALRSDLELHFAQLQYTFQIE